MPESTNRFPIKKGDTEPHLQVQIFNPDGTPRNVISDTVTFQMGQQGQSPVVTGGAVSKIDAANGIVEYAWNTADTDTVGQYRAEFVLNGDETFPKDGYIIVEVIETIA